MNTALKTLLASLTLALAGGTAMGLLGRNGMGKSTLITQHQANQAQRIHQGVASGQLTRREAVRLQRQQAAIRHAQRQARADGVVTASERHRIQRMQAQASRDIQRQKHDAQARASVTGFERR